MADKRLGECLLISVPTTRPPDHTLAITSRSPDHTHTLAPATPFHIPASASGTLLDAPEYRITTPAPARGPPAREGRPLHKAASAPLISLASCGPRPQAGATAALAIGRKFSSSGGRYSKGGNSSSSWPEKEEEETRVNEEEEEEREATPQWRFVGLFEDLMQRRCQRVFCQRGPQYDLGLFYDKVQQSFHALGAWCGHMGGPLFQGDIEDYKGSPHIMCPWHAYMFDLRTGKNDIGMEQSTFLVRVDQRKVFILHSSPLSIHPFL